MNTIETIIVSRSKVSADLWQRTLMHLGLTKDDDFKREQPRGNIMTQSIREIWYNREYTRRRFKLLLGVTETAACKRCMAGKAL